MGVILIRVKLLEDELGISFFRLFTQLPRQNSTRIAIEHRDEVEEDRPDFEVGEVDVLTLMRLAGLVEALAFAALFALLEDQQTVTFENAVDCRWGA